MPSKRIRVEIGGEHGEEVSVVDAETGEPYRCTSLRIEWEVGEMARLTMTLIGPVVVAAIPAIATVPRGTV